jgi:hypothetical protein
MLRNFGIKEMKPEVAQIWKDALDRLKRAEKHLAAGEIDVAKTEAKNAATSGLVAIMLFLRGREDDKKQSMKASEEALIEGFFEDWEKDCPKPQDYIAKALRILMRFSDLSENRLPFE